jgi:hypothetical protein
MIKINDKIGELTGSKLSANVLQTSFPNMVVTYDLNVLSVDKFMAIYQNEGFVKSLLNKNKVYNFEIYSPWIELITVEMVSGTIGGLGYVLLIGRELLDINQIMSVIIILIVINVAIEKLLLGKIENKKKKKIS